MDAYIYQAATYCPDCADKIKADLGFALEGKSEYEYDSGEYPKGPFTDGGGPTGYPDHCDGCGVFLENTLDPDGERYVLERYPNNPDYRDQYYYLFWDLDED